MMRKWWRHHSIFRKCCFWIVWIFRKLSDWSKNRTSRKTWNRQNEFLRSSFRLVCVILSSYWEPIGKTSEGIWRMYLILIIKTIVHHAIPNRTLEFRLISMNKTIHIHSISDSSFYTFHYFLISLSSQYLITITHYPQPHMSNTLSLLTIVQDYLFIFILIIFHWFWFFHSVVLLSLLCHYYLHYSTSAQRFWLM